MQIGQSSTRFSTDRPVIANSGLDGFEVVGRIQHYSGKDADIRENKGLGCRTIIVQSFVNQYSFENAPFYEVVGYEQAQERRTNKCKLPNSKRCTTEIN